jgi:hypothetical protein
MGILDDAIREHLDLQRRRGADPTEVERAERDALGPVRRGPEAAPGSDPDSVHDAESAEYEPEDHPSDSEGFDRALESEAYEPAPSEPATEIAREPQREPASDQDAESWSYESSAPQPETAALPPSRAEPPIAGPDDGLLAEPPASSAGGLAYPETSDPEQAAPAQPPASPPPHPAGGTTGTETAEYDVEAALDSEPHREGAEGEDVLEETPEFLQDTPDHDRLWFEQRPPKDFDFDG